ncbi:MAG: DUF892 family protein [Nitrospirota bacterium]
MVEVANSPKLKFRETFHPNQGQVERLRAIFELLGEKAEPKACKAMMGLVAEGEDTTDEGREKDPTSADFALIRGGTTRRAQLGLRLRHRPMSGTASWRERMRQAPLAHPR